MKKNYIPKKETQQSEFLAKYPEYDGRGIKIAIIDSGIDVSVPGFQKTSTGLPKIIDCIQFSHQGIVDISKIKKSHQNNVLIALSGRKIKIPSKWKNPSGKWHLGSESCRQICHINYRKEKVESYLKNFFRKQERCLQNANVIKKNAGNQKMNNNQKKDLSDIIDFVVWFDGEKWRACLIPAANFEDLENAKVITNFRDEFEYWNILDDITCCISISKNGNQLKMCTSLSPHGTEVAYVAAAHSPMKPKNDGLAPGAQIYFMDVREVEDGDVEAPIGKALIKCLELGVDIINISLNFCLTKSEIEIINDLQKKHGVIIVAGAGNTGPLYSTISRNEILDEIFYIASLETSEMIEMFYKMKQSNSLVEVSSYSSKGPLINNARGIDFGAPGGAIIPTSQWFSKEPRITQGTSYAAPIAAGTIACLLSALKAYSIPYSFATIKNGIAKYCDVTQK